MKKLDKKDKIFFSILICVLLLTMTVVTWGSLSKNQDDNETIEEAIARLVAVHLADSDAHIEAGQSLYTHKGQAIVDHPQSSIIMDKYNAKEDSHKCSFGSLDGWTTEGAVSNTAWPGVAMDIVDGEIEESSIHAHIVVPGGYLREAKDAMFQMTLYADVVANTYAVVFGFGAENLIPETGFGFIKDGASLKGYIKVLTTTVYTSEIGDDLDNTHIYRAYYNAGTDKVEFYIDGVLEESVARPAGNWNSNGNIAIYAKAQGEESGIIRVISVEVYSDLS